MRLVFGLMLALLLAALEQMIVATALPKIVAAGYPPVAGVPQVPGGERPERDLRLGHQDRGDTGEGRYPALPR